MSNTEQIRKAEQLFQLGTDFLQKGNLQEAEKYLVQSININNTDFKAFNHLGIVYQNLQDFNKSIDCFKKAIELNNVSINAHNNLAISYFQTDNAVEAEKILKSSYKIDNSVADTTFNLGLLYQQTNRFEEAIEYYRKTIEINNEFADAYLNLGVVLQDQKKYKEAILVYEAALKFFPDNAYLIFCLGFLCEVLKEFKQAKKYYERAKEIDPNFIKCRFNLGNVYKEIKEWKLAEIEYRKVIELDSTHTDAFLNLGNCLTRFEKYDKAIECFSTAYSHNKNNSGALLNWGAVLLAIGKPKEAVQKYDEALKINPNDQAVHFNKGIALLSDGEFENGWAEYEWRANNSCGFPMQKSPKLWQGEELNNKTLLIREEQGIGDLIQFIRYAKLLKEEGAKVILQCRSFLHELMRSIDGIDIIIAPDKMIERFDYEISIMSLPYVFQTDYLSVPQNFPYISIDKKLVEEKKSEFDRSKPKIGLIWKGNPDHAYDHLRSFKLTDLEELISCGKYNFVSLQMDLTEEERELLNKYNIKIYQDDFINTAAIISNLDLLISVDTSIAHLAGALNKPVWNLLAYYPDWRWLLEGSSTPWYTSMKLVRQQINQTRKDFLSNLRSSLKEYFNMPESNQDLVRLKVLALEAHKAGRLAEAEELYKTHLQLDPSDDEINYWIGLLLKSKNEFEECAKYFKKVEKNSAQYITSLKEVATVFVELKDYENAINSYKEIIDFEENGVASKNLANIYFGLKDYYQAEVYFKEALKSISNDFDLLNNLGLVLQIQNKLKESEKYLLEAGNLVSNHKGIIYNIGSTYYLNRELEKALSYYENCISIDENYTDAHLSKGFIHFQREEFEKGWEEFEYCVSKRPELSKNGLSKYWDGESGENKTIYIYSEQGLGDTIQFSRYLPKLYENGFKVIYECEEILSSLFIEKTYLEKFIPKGKSEFVNIEYDYYCSILSLARIFKTDKTNVPSNVNIFSINDGTLQDTGLAFPAEKLKVGITWKGNPKHGNDHNRSIDIKLIAILFDCTDVEFYSLLEEITNEDEQFLSRYSNYQKVQVDFEKLVSVVNEMDLIISVDTMMAHLAGTLNKKVWTLLPFMPDWRWLLDTEKSIWYDSMKLYRQNEPGNWNSAIQELENDFKNLIQDKSISANISDDEHLQLGKNHLDNGRIEEAKIVFEKLIKNNDHNFEAHFFLAYTFQILKHSELAVQYYLKVINIKPDYSMAYNNLGLLLMDFGKFEESIKCLTACIKIEPNNALVYNNLALACELNGQFEDAVNYAKEAIKFDENFAGAYLNMATSYHSLNKIDKALEAINNSLRINPDYVEANFNKAMILLKEKNFEEGWSYYEWRTKYVDYPRRVFSKPLLKNQEISGKTILVYDEQGYGDTIMFARYLNLLKEKGAKIVFECHKSLEPLFENSKSTSMVLSRKSLDEPKIEYDYHIPLLSLPKYFNTEFASIPQKSPYINIDSIDSDKFKNLFNSFPKYKIGLVWEGRMPVNNRYRAIPLEKLKKLAKYNQIQLFSLQVGEASERESELMKEMGIISLSDKIDSFLDTASIIKNLDLVISIDTSVAHLAGAIGAEIWTLLATKADWRWFKDINYSPWYPSMKLYRQTWYGNWDDVVEKIMDDLNNKLLNIHFKEN